MSLIGSGERVIILSDRVSTSDPVGADQETPAEGRILIFRDAVGDLWSKDSSGAIRPINGGTLSDASWEAVAPATSPSPAGDVTHVGRAAVGLPTSGPMHPGVQFQVVGSSAQGGSLYIEETGEGPDLADHTQIFTLDKGLYAKPDGLPSRRIDAPGMVRKFVPDAEEILVPNGSQYLVYGSFALGTGSVLILEGDADLVVL